MTKPTRLTWTDHTAFVMSTQEMTVDLVDDTGAIYQLVLDEEHREALGMILLDPPGAEPGEPVVFTWDREVSHPDDPREDTVVCCRTLDGRPAALLVDELQRQTLGLYLSDPTGQRDVHIQRTPGRTTYTQPDDVEDDDTP
ncbi:hypothetical protein [Streptomyces sp. NPDC056069]|uniref:hypothetical protein n=1 Tax=Streptomyces sp. NPDC056069 TaxID=3345702 RepID=UPI0035E0937D